MDPTQPTQVDLGRSFSTVTKALKEKQAALNEADSINHNHGDNMVKNFQVITTAVRKKKTAPPSEQLAYASQVLAQRTQSGSAQMYSQGLAQAATRLQGERGIDAGNVMTLVQSLMGSGQPAGGQSQAAGGLGDLLGGLLGGGMQQESAQQQAGAGGGLGDLLGSLMGGTSGQPAQQQQAGTGGGLDMGTLLSAGMAFFQAREQGQQVLPALVQAVMSGSQMSNSPHHSQSGELVTSTLLNTIGSMLGGKK